MTFTYSTALSTTRDKVRFELGDVLELQGLRPNGKNFSDEEITYAYAQEGSHLMKTVARLCEILSREYAAYAGFQALSESAGEYNRKSAEFAKRAAEIRAVTGDAFGVADASAVATAGSKAAQRVDGYSQTIDADDV